MATNAAVPIAPIGQELDRLRDELGSDCCLLGLFEGETRMLRWKLASGSAGERYREVEERADRGLGLSAANAGQAVSLQLADLIASLRLYEYPILLAENLRSAYAVPFGCGGRAKGVLLAGHRKRRVFRPSERERIREAGGRIAGLLACEACAACKG